MIAGSRTSFAFDLEQRLRKLASGSDVLQRGATWRGHLVLVELGRLIVDEGHGGTILIVPAEQGDWLGSLNPFAFKFATPDNTIRDCMQRGLFEAMKLKEFNQHVSAQSLLDSDKSTGDLGQYLWNPRDVLRPTAALAGCDGAIVMTQDLQVLGFGAKIATHSTSVNEVHELYPGGREALRSPLEKLGGTRHQSAARFVATHQDAWAIVISQDRHMSVVLWDQSLRSVLFLRNADWWV
jgi:hypothetical protein